MTVESNVKTCARNVRNAGVLTYSQVIDTPAEVLGVAFPFLENMPFEAPQAKGFWENILAPPDGNPTRPTTSTLEVRHGR